MRSDAVLFAMYEEGRMSEMTPDELLHFKSLPQFRKASSVTLPKVVEVDDLQEHERRERSATSDKPKSTEWPKHILRPKGLLGNIVDWIVSQSGMYQPKFALAAALAACGTLLGRCVSDFSGLLTSVFILAVGRTSAGKNDPIKCVVHLLNALGRSRTIAGELTSDAALESELLLFPVKCLVLDEVGHYLGSVKSAGQNNGHLKTVIPALTKCWSATSGVYHGKSRAPDTNGKVRPSRQIHRPCVCVYGTSAPDVLFQSMTDDDFRDGSIPRYLVFQSDTRPQRIQKEATHLPEELRTELNNALVLLGSQQSNFSMDAKAENLPPPKTIPMTDEARMVFEAFEELKTENLCRADDGETPLYLYGKAVENAQRVALIVACLNNPANPVVDEYAASYSVELVTRSVCEMIESVRQNVASSRQEREKLEVLRAIRRAGSDGLSKSELTRRTRAINRGDRDDYLLDLIDEKSVEEIKVREKSGGKEQTWYRFVR